MNKSTFPCAVALASTVLMGTGATGCARPEEEVLGELRQMLRYGQTLRLSPCFELARLPSAWASEASGDSDLYWTRFLVYVTPSGTQFYEDHQFGDNPWRRKELSSKELGERLNPGGAFYPEPAGYLAIHPKTPASRVQEALRALWKKMDPLRGLVLVARAGKSVSLPPNPDKALWERVLRKAHWSEQRDIDLVNIELSKRLTRACPNIWEKLPPARAKHHIIDLAEFTTQCGRKAQTLALLRYRFFTIALARGYPPVVVRYVAPDPRANPTVPPVAPDTPWEKIAPKIFAAISDKAALLAPVQMWIRLKGEKGRLKGDKGR